MKLVLVVGGAGALGSALVRQLLDQKLDVVVAGRSATTDERARKSYLIDGTNVDWSSLYSTIENDSGRQIDGLVFVAGTAAYGRTASFPLERARTIFELNFWACTTAARAIAEHWSEARLKGKFVAVLSMVAQRAVPFEAYYSASKSAAARFLECLDLEYAPKHIRFLCALPGMLNSPFRQQAEWYGLEPTSDEPGADVRATARAIEQLLMGRRKARVIGWRERTIDLADRLAPGLYEWAILRRRVARALNE